MHRFTSALALIATVLTCATAPAGAAGFILTQNTSSAITAGNSVSCPPGAPHADNSYWRRFDLVRVGATTTCFRATAVDFGVELADSPGGSQPVVVRLYTIPNASPLNLANLQPIGEFQQSVGNQALTILTAPVVTAGIDPFQLDLVVEVFTPSGQAAGNRFLIGSNSFEQTAPCYLSAAACGLTEPADTASEAVGYPNMHLYITVTGTDCLTPSLAQTWGRLKTLYR